MNPDYINHRLTDNTLNKYAFKTCVPKESYLQFKEINYPQKWDKIYKPYDLNKPLDQKYLGTLPYDHGYYNDREHYNTFSTGENFIPPSYRINEYPPASGVLASVFRNR